MVPSVFPTPRQRPSKKTAKSLKNVWRSCPSVYQLEDRTVPSTFLVNTTNDVYVPPVPASPPTNVSLRYALELLHIDSSGPTDTILLPEGPTVNGAITPATYDIQQPLALTPGGATIVDSLGNTLGGAFVIAPTASVVNVVIEGGINPTTGLPDAAATPADTVIDAQGFDRVFEILAASDTAILNVTFINLTIQHGAPATNQNNPPGLTDNGGGVFFDDPGAAPNQNNVTFNDVVVQNNLAPGEEIKSPLITSSDGAVPGDATGGGGIFTYNAAVNLINGSLVTNNHTDAEGGGIATQTGSILVSASGVNNNTARVEGGGIYFEGDAGSEGSTITIVGPGATVNHNSTDGDGGGISASNLTSISITNAQVNNNLAGGSGGGVNTNAASILVQTSSVDANQAARDGGGFDLNSASSPAGNEMSVIGSDISNNRAGAGGGAIRNDDVTTLTITFSGTTNSTLNNNIAGGDGGAIENLAATTLNVFGVAATSGPNGAQFIGNDAQSSTNNGSHGNGGGIFSNVRDESVLLDLVTFSGNDAGLSGGAVFEVHGESFTITGSGSTPSLFSNNEADDSAGGVYSDSTVVNISSTQFLNNGAAEASGGGVHTGGTDTSITGGTLFSGNQSGANGGALYSTATNLVLNNVAQASQPTSGLFGNSATDNGGGTYFSGTNLSIANSFLLGNVADNSGGGLYASLGTGTVQNTLVANNASNSNGGGAYVTGGGNSNFNTALTTIAANQTAGSGGGLYTSVATTKVVNTDLLTNSAATGGGGIAYETGGSGNTLDVVQSSLISNTAGGQGSGGGILANAGSGSYLNVINSTIAANTAGVAGGGISNTAGTTASLLYTTVAFNQAAQGGGIATTGTAMAPVFKTYLGNSIVAQNFNFAPAPPSYPGTNTGNPDPVPPFPSPNATGPDIQGTVADLTEAEFLATLNGTGNPNAPAPIPTSGVDGAGTIGSNVIGTSNGSAGSTLVDANNHDYVGTVSSPILAVNTPSPNGGSTLLGPTLPGSQAQYMAAPLTGSLALQNGFSDLFIFAQAPSDQRGSVLFNSGGSTQSGIPAGTSGAYFRPLTDNTSTNFSENPDIGAMQLTPPVSP